MNAYRYGPALRVPGRGLVDVSAWRNSEGAWVLCAGHMTRMFYGYSLREARRLMAQQLGGAV